MNMFNKNQLIENFGDMIAEIERMQKLFMNEKREHENTTKRTDAALSRCADMIETLANALADAKKNPELVKDARVYLSILHGYVKPYTPSKTYPSYKNIESQEPYKSWVGKIYPKEKKKRGKPKKK